MVWTLNKFEESKANSVIEKMIDDNIKDVKEIMANAFAAELLIPEKNICSTKLRYGS
ncbi:hypothetical protein KTC92_14910 [Clostridium sp. CM027]|uniref:hypothetical protein n=1 Tax=Clostridium sp. CM027 TaxID=2849865 RepID=UPI001C6E9486|nr:hypothetical protein [Clostridium sp. CM027]MBW9145271.1 hypothetical protein [Clostridium sp. CM027]UVE40400.1 hypothetical protein KTC92_14910 [Clostridium sp. CM027]